MIPLQLQLRKDDSVRQVQDKFSELFPHLQIKIFRHVDGKKPGSCQDIMLCPEVRMIEMNTGFRDGFLRINGNQTVAGLEKGFLEQFGLCAEVFRKNGGAVKDSVQLDSFLLENKMTVL